MTVKDRPGVLVVGDVCLDVVGLPKSVPTGPDVPPENWRQTGELRTHYMPGGAMLLAKFIRNARQAARLEEIGATKSAASSETIDWEALIAGPRPLPPAGLLEKAEPLSEGAFMRIAARVSREEVLHSIIGAELFPTTSNPDDKSTVPRVRYEHGYSGPAQGNPTLEVRYAVPGRDRFVVISDTGNQIRYQADSERFNDEVLKGAVQVVYKLHRPLPDSVHQNVLWNLAKKAGRQDTTVVVIDVEDLRAEEVPISQGLSWERTALDVVWHFLNVERLSELRDCPALIVRLGLDGAMLWRRIEPTPKDSSPFEAWIVYDPAGIEGTLSATVLGRMVGLGSAFTAAVVESLAEAFTAPVDADKPADRSAILVEAIKSGLLASRRLLTTGFVEEGATKDLQYPGPSLFRPRDEKNKEVLFAHRSVPIIQGALQPDRSYWRLLDAIFDGTGRIQEAVELLATNRKGTKAPGSAQVLLDSSPRARFGNLTTFDRREIEHYRSLYTLLRDYLRAPNPPRPLSVAVFGPPGAGKSFGVKEVGKSLKGQPGCRDIETLTFNLSLFRTPDDLAGAFHLVRDVVLRGKVPLVFFDEFDTSLGDIKHGWLRHFLAPMQDGEFLDREAPHPIGPAIFVFAGGTCATFARFECQSGVAEKQQFISAKGPDFISRLRATLDIPSLNLAVAFHHDEKAGANDVVTMVAELLKAQGWETFDPYGPIEAVPSRAAVLLRRAGILAFNLPRKAPSLVRADKSLAITKPVLRALMHLPQFNHGNRSFEALLDMSHLDDCAVYTPARLPAPFQTTLHADSAQLSKLVGTDYPFPEADRELIARAIHQKYLEDNKDSPVKTRAYVAWDKLVDDDRVPNFEQVDDIATKLRTAGLWFRKRAASGPAGQDASIPDDLVDLLAVLEHDRWAAQKRRQGWAPAVSTQRDARRDDLLLHNCLFPWNALPKLFQNLDRTAVQSIPKFLKAAGYEVFKP